MCDLIILQLCLNLLMYSNTSSLSLCLVHSNCNSASVTVAIRYVSFSGTFIASHRCLGSAMGSFGVSFSKIFVFFYALPRFCAYFAFLFGEPGVFNFLFFCACFISASVVCSFSSGSLCLLSGGRESKSKSLRLWSTEAVPVQ